MDYIHKPSVEKPSNNALNFINIPVILLPNIDDKDFNMQKEVIGTYESTYMSSSLPKTRDRNKVISNINKFNNGIKLIKNILTLGRTLENDNNQLNPSSFDINTETFTIVIDQNYLGTNDDMGQSSTETTYAKYIYKAHNSNIGWRITTTPNLRCDVQIYDYGNHPTTDYVTKFMAMIKTKGINHNEDDYYNFFINLLSDRNFRISYYIPHSQGKFNLFSISKVNSLHVKVPAYCIYIDKDFFNDMSESMKNSCESALGLGPDTKPAAGLPPREKAFSFPEPEPEPEPVQEPVQEPVPEPVPVPVPVPVSKKSLFSRLGRAIANPFKKLTRKSSRKGSSRKGLSRKGSSERRSSRKGLSSNA